MCKDSKDYDDLIHGILLGILLTTLGVLGIAGIFNSIDNRINDTIDARIKEIRHE